ncbi:MAG TPA: hypothetical protein VH539_06975 [Gemmatimonadaceae bacterium]|jgi:hypothetical protein
MRWFGRRYRAPLYHEIDRTATPVGVACFHCDELIVDGDDGFAIPSFAHNEGIIYLHRECQLRGVLGSVSHIQKLCSCYVPGSLCGDPEGMTRREAARAAVREYERLEGFPLTSP